MNRRTALKRSALLMGSGLAGTVFAGMLQGCQVDTGLDWSPAYFDPSEARFISAFSEHLLPRTNTPGAQDVFVDRFLDQLIAEGFTAEQQAGFRAGLAELQGACRDLHGKDFLGCSREEKDAFFKAQEALPGQPEHSLWGSTIVAGDEPSFYRQLKGLCLFGYFSSEEVGERVLRYDPVPGKFVGCVPLSEIGNAWSL